LTDDFEWDPESVDLGQGKGQKLNAVDSVKGFVANCESDMMLSSVSEALTLNTQSIWAVNRKTKRVVSEKRHNAITPEQLARMWGIGIETAKETLSVTTQRGVRLAVHPLH
jgi:hypothetical protein